MKPRLKALLVAGMVTSSMIACSEESPTGPAQDPTGEIGQSGVSAKMRPANDDFDDATLISALPFVDTVNTVGARTSHDDPLNDETCGFGSIGGHTVWYEFTPSANIRVNASTVGSDFNPNVFVYTGTRGNLTRVACNPLPRSVTFEALAGETYFILVGSQGTEPGGNLVFQVDTSIEVGITIDPVARVDRATGVVTITGTVTCSRPAFFELGGTVQQRKVQGSLFAAGGCDGVSPWQAEVQGENGRFVSGNAEVTAGALFTADDTQEERHADQVTATVRLR